MAEMRFYRGVSGTGRNIVCKAFVTTALAPASRRCSGAVLPECLPRIDTENTAPSSAPAAGNRDIRTQQGINANNVASGGQVRSRTEFVECNADAATGTGFQRIFIRHSERCYVIR